MTLASGQTATALRGISATWLVGAGVVAAAILLRCIEPTNGDVSWLIVVSEKVLDGARPYRDFIEVNPPASIGLYLPGVALARVLGVRAELVIDLLVFLGTAASLWLSATILSPTRRAAPRLGFGALAILLVLPANAFAEREHLVVIAILPSLAALVLRMGGRTPALVPALLAGVAAGVAVSVKPIFSLAFAGPLLALWLTVSWRAALQSLEVWVAAGFASLYGAIVLWAFPDFIHTVLPLVMQVYVPTRLEAARLITSPATLLWAALCITWMMLSSAARRHPPALILFLASLGFAVAFPVQGKGWAYHSYPALALMGLAIAAALDQTAKEERLRQLLTPEKMLLILAPFTFFWLNKHYDLERNTPDLAPAIARISPHPTMMTITDEFAIGFPLVRDVGGRWVGTFPAAWINSAAAYLRDTNADVDRAALDTAERLERTVYAADIQREKPDIILIDGAPWHDWIAGDVNLSTALASYRLDGTFGTLELWRRATP